MIRVYSSPDWMLVDTYRSILESYGIGSDARITGLWVLNDAKADQARSIILSPSATARIQRARERAIRGFSVLPLELSYTEYRGS